MPRHNSKQANRNHKKDAARSGSTRFKYDQMNQAVEMIAGENFCKNHILLEHDPDRQAKLNEMRNRGVDVQTIILVTRKELTRLQKEMNAVNGANESALKKKPHTACTALAYPVIQIENGEESTQELFIRIKSEYDAGTGSYVFSHLENTIPPAPPLDN